MKRALLYIFILLFNLGDYAILHAQVVGQLYCMPYNAGAPPSNNGTINMFDPLNNKDTALVSFNSADGQSPYSTFIQAKNGLLYSMTSQGGSHFNMGDGVILSYNIVTGQENVLYNFSENHNGTDANEPYGSLLLDTNGLMYGMTYYGGNSGLGTIFSFSPVTDSEKVLYSMTDTTIGYSPTGNLIQASNGLLYGNTTAGGLYGFGTIFNYDITRDTVILLHSFNNTDGNYPRGSLLQINDSMLYGLTFYGGVYYKGVLFSFNINTDSETVLYSFPDNPYGAYPGQSLMRASDGNLYGTTFEGGDSEKGTLFRYNIDSNTITDLVSFNDLLGYSPFGDVIQATNHLLYGLDTYGGTINVGTIFSYDITTQTETTLYSFNDTTGGLPSDDLLEIMSAASIITNNICPDDSAGVLTINARGGKPPFTYLWSTGATTSSISNLPSGAYTYTVTDSTGMTLIYTYTVNPTPIILSFNSSNPCYGEDNGSASVNISGGAGPFTYSWSNGSRTDTANNLTAGTYSVLITDAQGCPSATDAVIISQAGILTINGFTITKSTYPGYDNGKITVNVSGGIPPGDSSYYLYLWSIGGASEDSITGLDSGTYAVCVTSPYGCGSVCDSNINITGLENLDNPGTQVKIYPVPSTGLINISLEGEGFENLEITDAMGREVYRQPLNPQQPGNILHIDLGGLAEGVYILHINSRQSVITGKIIIQI
jgi:uncharacterized repeat protein (TIGR03803 family)